MDAILKVLNEKLKEQEDRLSLLNWELEQTSKSNAKLTEQLKAAERKIYDLELEKYEREKENG